MLSLDLARAEEGGDPHAFRVGPQEYHLRWPDGGIDVFQIRWDEALLADLAALREASPEAAQRLGEWLRALLAPTRWRLCEERLIDADRRGEAVHVALRSAAAELYALPWELLAVGASGRHLGELPHASLRYRWPGASALAAEPAARREGGRIVLGWSRAFGPVGEPHFLAAIAGAARAGALEFDPGRDVIQDMSFASLVDGLEQRCRAAAAGEPAPVILHLLCHGAAAGAGYGLGLDGPGGAREVIDAARIRQLAPFAGFVRLVVLTTCDGGNPGAPGSRLGSVAQARHRAGFESVIASRAPLGGAAALTFAEVFYRELLATPASVEVALAAARRRLRTVAAGLDWASLHLLGHGDAGEEARPLVFRPYRGLLTFEAAHARFFFGRDPERDETLRDLDALIAAGKPRMLLVAGASGTGKSSVVLAGVLPILHQRGWQSTTLRPGNDPHAALDAALARRTGASETGPKGAGEPVLQGARLVLVVDQFEEVFTHAVEASAAQRFVRRLWQLASDERVFTAVVLTMRVDYLGHCGDLILGEDGTRFDRVAYDEAHRVLVPQIDRQRLRLTIEVPAAKVGLALDPGLSERLLEQVGDEPGALPLLQHALDELWTRRAGDALTHAALAAIGGAVGAMTRRAEAVLTDMSGDEAAAARRVLVRMVSYGEGSETGTRRQVLEDALRPAAAGPRAAFERAVQALVDARLVVRARVEGAAATLDISHEALIRRWGRLRTWFEEDRQRLAEQAQLDLWAEEWRKFPGNLLTGNRLGFAERLRDQYGDEIGAAALELIDRSRAAEAARVRRRRGVTAAIVAILSVAAIVSFAFAWQLAAAEREADRKRVQAERATAVGETRRLVALAGAELGRGSLGRALLLAVEAARTEEKLDGEMMIGGVSAVLREILAEIPDHRVLPHEHPVHALAFAPDGSGLATADDRQEVVLWPLDRPGPPERVGTTPLGLVRELAVSRDGAHVLASSADGGALWSRPFGEPRLFRDERGDITDVTLTRLSPAGTHLALLRGALLLYRTGDGGPPRELLPQPELPLSDTLTWSRDGGRLFVATPHATHVWDLEHLDAPLVTRIEEPLAIHSATLDREGLQVAASVYDEIHGSAQVRTWRLDRPDPPTLRQLPVCSLQFGEDGRYAANNDSRVWLSDTDAIPLEGALAGLFLGRQRRLALVWPTDDPTEHPWLTLRDLDGGRELAALKGHDRQIRAAVFDATGERVATGSYDRTARVWPIGAREPVLQGAQSEPRNVPLVSSFQWAPDGEHLLAHESSKFGDRILRCARDGRCAPWRTLPGHAFPLAFSPSGRRLAYEGGDSGELVVVELEGAEAPPQRTPVARKERHALAKWTADEARLVLQREDGQVELLQRDTGELRVITRSAAREVTLSPDGAWLAIQGDAELSIWPIDPVGPPRVLLPTRDPIEHLAFSRDGAHLVVVPAQGRVVLLPVREEGAPRTFGGLGETFRWAELSPDGTHLVTGGPNGLVQLWWIDGSRHPLALQGHKAPITGGAFSPDGAVLATSSRDGTIRLWRADGRGEASALAADEARDLLFSRDGARLATLDFASTRIWTVHTADLVARACSLVGHEFTSEEWREVFGPDLPQRPTCGAP